ncbi:MAG: hypothetical protein K2O34_11865 [Acetatifactor sp.]|nr:hypothetical protein [Acetatifactor sp.]
MHTCITKYPWLRKIFIVLFSYLSVLSLARIIALNGDGAVYFGGTYFGYNLTSVLYFAVTAWLLHRFLRLTDRRLRTVSSAGGILLGLAIVYGGYAHYANNIFISVSEGLLQPFLALGISACTTPLCAELLQLPSRFESRNAGRRSDSVSRIQTFLSTRPWCYFLLTWGILMISYMPLFLSQWPGNFVFDAKYQMSEVCYNSYSTHHPLLHTLLMGSAYKLGLWMGSASAGFQFYTLFQMLVLTGVFAYLLLYLYKKKAPACIRICALLWFALFPMHSLFAISATKDVLFAAFFLWHAIFLFRLLMDRERFTWHGYVGMILSGVLMVLFRNNALYALCAAGLILLLFLKPLASRLRYLCVLAAILLLSSLSGRALVACTNAHSPDANREMMSVPLQGMARVASYRGSELDPALYEEICQYIPQEDIPLYNPYISDPIKGHANEELLRDNKVNLFKLWLKVGLQFPDEYLESIITNTMGFWYPLNQGRYVSMDIALYHTLIGVDQEITKHDYFPPASQLYNYFFYHGNGYSTPVLAYFFRSAPYIWLLVFTLLWSIWKKRYRLLLWGMLPLMYLGTCFLGPTAALRYIYCLVVCVPLLLYGMVQTMPTADPSEK